MFLSVSERATACLKVSERVWVCAVYVCVFIPMYVKVCVCACLRVWMYAYVYFFSVSLLSSYCHSF